MTKEVSSVLMSPRAFLCLGSRPQGLRPADKIPSTCSPCPSGPLVPSPGQRGGSVPLGACSTSEEAELESGGRHHPRGHRWPLHPLLLPSVRGWTGLGGRSGGHNHIPRCLLLWASALDPHICESAPGPPSRSLGPRVVLSRSHLSRGRQRGWLSR